jgi:hypothetical protein
MRQLATGGGHLPYIQRFVRIGTEVRRGSYASSGRRFREKTKIAVICSPGKRYLRPWLILDCIHSPDIANVNSPDPVFEIIQIEPVRQSAVGTTNSLNVT